jgi:hypothetical protein
MNCLSTVFIYLLILLVYYKKLSDYENGKKYVFDMGIVRSTNKGPRNLYVTYHSINVRTQPF